MALDFQGPIDIPFRKFEDKWLDIPVFRIFSDVVQRQPDKIALKCGNNQLSYQEVYHLAIHIARAIQINNPNQEPVGIALPNDTLFPVAMLAALAVGCPYVPLDIDLPAVRNQLIIDQSGLKSIITNSDQTGISGDFNVINIDKLQLADNKSFHFNASPEDIAYIIYTSGSTGMPKGVYQNQKNLLHDVLQYTNSVHLSENDRLTLLYSPSVNGAIRDIYGALLNGATLLIKNLKKTGLYDLSAFIRDEAITIYHSIPNIFRTFLKLNPVKTDLSTVRMIYLAGDRIYNSDVDLYKELFPAHCLLYVGIGATEIATIYRQWFINHDTPINQELIPLGYPVDERIMQLVDDHNNPVPAGETGEIIVSSPFVSLGYWKNTSLSSQSFIVNPESPEIRTYRTGDLGRINRDGLLEFIGRKDNQVKINGYRVELSEIEGALMNHPAIERCGVITYTKDKHNSLYSFFISKTEISETALKTWLADKLPHYMVPQRCIQVSEIPTLHNFKNDNKALKALAEKYTIPKESEEILAHISKKSDFLQLTLRGTWSRFLDEYSFDNNINWKSAGGDSVNAVNFLVQLESDLGTSLPTDWIHGEMSPEEIYAFLKGLNVLEKLKPENIIYVFPAVIGIGENARVFLKNLSEHVTVRIITYPDFTKVPAKKRNWEYANEVMLPQIPDYDSPNVGFMGLCTGAAILSQLIVAHPIKHYSIIGIVEGTEVYIRKPLYTNFFKKAVSFFQRGDILNDLIRFIYNRTDALKGIIHYLEEKKLYKTTSVNLLWHLCYPLRPAYFHGDVLYFGCKDSFLNKDGNHWKPYFRSINHVYLNGVHSDMLDAQNRKIVLNELIAILESQ